MGQGYTTRKNAEDVLLFRRGKPERISKSVHEIIIAPRRDHSRKPEEFYERAEKYCPGPRLEMFTRFTRPGWSAWGNEATKFNEAAE
jgi:N6-adenosine-specific RNA methylase IME4